MSNLTLEEVAALAKAAGLVVSDDDLLEVTHRLNVTISGIEKFTHPALDTITPLPFRPLEDVNDE